jgi:hypothetical protein
MVGKVANFSGIVHAEEVGGSNRMNYLFRNNKVFQLSVNSQNQSSNSDLRTNTTTCYYLNIYSCDIDLQNNTASNYNLVLQRFLGCYDEGGDNEEIDWIDNNDGGGAMSSYEDESYDSDFTGNSEEATITSQQAYYDDENQKFKANIGYKWKCGTGETILKKLGIKELFKWDYFSNETATVEKSNQSDPYLFTPGSIAHSSILLIGTVPLNYDYTVSLGYAVSNIHADRRKATMELWFVVQEKISASAGISISSTKSWEETETGIMPAP